jgi:shikimate dehydrogenase
VTDLVVLLGHRIAYSASPAVHAAAFAALGIDARYELADVEPDGLAESVAELRGADRLGANVTQPHKVAVCDLVDSRAPAVERLGAANTVVREGDRLVAHNTDLPAVRAELRGLAGARSAVVLGTGGAARAVVAALDDLGVPAVSLGRARWTDLPDRIAASDLLVHATPIGTASDESPVPAALLRPDLAVLDLVYRPTPSRLVRDARAAGGRARGGAGMLLRQAAASFELWTRRAAPVEVMREALERELGASVDA